MFFLNVDRSFRSPHHDVLDHRKVFDQYIIVLRLLLVNILYIFPEIIKEPLILFIRNKTLTHTFTMVLTSGIPLRG